MRKSEGYVKIGNTAAPRVLRSRDYRGDAHEADCSKNDMWKGLLPKHRRLQREVPLQSREDVLLTDSHDRRMRDTAFNGNRIKRLLDIRNDANPMDRKAASDRAFDRDRDGEKSKPRLA